jgi:hypothetical protein
VKAVTGRDTDPTPKKSGRRRSGDGSARQHFVRAAKRLTRLHVRPVSAAASALLWLADSLDWLDLWQHNTVLDDQPQDTPNNHLSPRL